uniref:Uncharacterized protein n=1 Tax=Anguilla anguilla TaxID=7936 RepID=A0A0E9WB98_ANGAN
MFRCSQMNLCPESHGQHSPNWGAIRRRQDLIHRF